MFLIGGTIILIITAIFFFAGKRPYSLAVYIGFGFVWLSIILYVCLSYLISHDAPEIEGLMNIGYAAFFCAVFVCGVIFPDVLGLFNLIFVDFLLVCAILVYMVVIRFLQKNK